MKIEQIINKYLIEADDPNKKRKQAIRDKIEDLGDDLADLNTGKVSVEMNDPDIKKKKAAIRVQIEKLQDQLKAIK